jgi:hypothetical protein
MHLEPRIGSDSTGHSSLMYGMGLAIMDTLPSDARRLCHRRRRAMPQEASCPTEPSLDDPSQAKRSVIPFRIPVYKRVTHIPYTSSIGSQGKYQRLAHHLPILGRLGKIRRVDWLVQPHLTRMAPDGNVVTLGGISERSENCLRLESRPTAARTRGSPIYLNSKIVNGLKILMGFIPAFLSFYLTNSWWVLAYLGAFIWFGITGLRNILQSVLGGGGLRRTPLLQWKDYVNWVRISDSLLYTGFSVPLLDYAIKTLLLDRFMGITTTTHPITLYTIMAIANGCYLSSHNLFRGLPKGAVYGNFFRSILSIPIAVGFNMLIGTLLGMFGVAAVDIHLQKWAAVISKGASDTVAGVIEGTADRFANIKTRFQDYADAISQLFHVYSQLEVLLPELNVGETLEAMGNDRMDVHADAKDLEKLMIIGSLDLLYFWMYQPRARTALKYLTQTLSDEEKRILAGCQAMLKQERRISQMFIDGVMGMDFSKGLSFYLQCWPDYLKTTGRLLAPAKASGPTA